MCTGRPARILLYSSLVITVVPIVTPTRKGNLRPTRAERDRGKLTLASMLFALASTTTAFVAPQHVLWLQRHSMRTTINVLLADDAGVAERDLLSLIEAGGRASMISSAIEKLESLNGIESPALSPLIEGKWKLVHTSSSTFDPRNPLGRRTDGSTPGLEAFFSKILGGDGSDVAASSSPIQRAVTSAFSVEQELRDLASSSGRVEQRVQTPVGTLHLNARASVGSERPARVDFAFDEGYFEFTQEGLPRIPYPVPFRLLGKEAEGFVDTSYLSETLRVSTGNKGTVFVLTRAWSDQA